MAITPKDTPSQRRQPPEPTEEKARGASKASPRDRARRAAYRQGLLVLVGLAILTALEFLVASALGGSIVFLFVLALVKAGLILQYYMHVNRLWSEEETH
jgi:heme/copper-type cytochrome/quinol oxidase subunit 4